MTQTPTSGIAAAASDGRRVRRLHEQAIDSLVNETKVDEDVVRMLYEAEHARLAADAKIKTYVPVIAASIVRKTLRSNRSRVQ